MNAASFGSDGGVSHHHDGNTPYRGSYSSIHDSMPYQQQQNNILVPSSDGGLTGGSMAQSRSHLTNGMGSLNLNSNHHAHVDGSASINTSMASSKSILSSDNHNSSASRPASTNFPVKYRISWNKFSNAFTITLIVPKRSHGQEGTAPKTKSPFQLVNDGSNNNLTHPTNSEQHALRIPLPYLVKLSKQSSASSHQPPTATWLDRSTLRTRLSDGGKAVGLDPSQIFQSIAAVEECATRIAEWAPDRTEGVDVNILLSDGIVSLVAKVNAGSSRPPPPNQNDFNRYPNQPQDQNHQARKTTAASDSSMLHFNYNVLNESNGSSLVASAPSFSSSAGDLSLLSKNDNQFHAAPNDSFSSNNNNGGSDRGLPSFVSAPNNEGIFGPPKGSLSSSYDPWAKSGASSVSRMGFAQEYKNDTNQMGLNGNADNYLPNNVSHDSMPKLNLLSSDPPVQANQLFPGQHNGKSVGINRAGSEKESMENSNMRRRSSATRPDPMIILEPLLSMGFTRAECEAAIMAIQNISAQERLAQSHGSSQGHISRQRSLSASSHSGHNDSSLQHEHYFHERQPNSLHNGNVGGDDILGYNLNTGNNASPFEQNMAAAVAADTFQPTPRSRSQSSVTDFQSNGSDSPDLIRSSSNGPVWGNAGKLKVVKSSSGKSNGGANTSAGTDFSGHMSSSSSTATPSWNAGVGAQSQKIVKVMEIPPDLNAFVFHCNAQTREECLEKGLFGCPSGGQYGPHSKAKKGDLLFLADFSAWTVSGIFTAKTDAGLNLDKSAWNGRFPWQIKVDTWTDLRTVHIDKVNEIIGLASGSKLNMLTKEQLTQLVTSKEFGPCVPPHLFKVKSVPQSSPRSPQMDEKAKQSEYQEPRDTVAHSLIEVNSNVGLNGIKYNRQTSTSSASDEHPATAMHRLKLVTSWFDSLASDVLTMNEVFNRKKSSPRRDGQKESKVLLDENFLGAIKSSLVASWPLMNYSHIRRAVADIFDQWLFLAHSFSGKKERSTSEHDSTWTRQQSRSSSSNSKMKEDTVLLQRVPGAAILVQKLFQATSGTSAMSVPEKIAELLAIKFINEVEQISTEVRKTQISLMKIGGDNYMQSIEDKALGMKITEGLAKQPGLNQESIEKVIMRIEWHTKSSRAQGRPPQVQKVFKSHFEVLERSYRNQASAEDPHMYHFLSRLFVLLCRYDLIGDVTHRCQTFIPPMAQEALTSRFGVGHDCFASPLCPGRSSFNSPLFADSCKFFGSLGSFFDFVPIEGSFLANPPFSGGSLKPMFDHVFRLLQHSNNDKSALSFLIAMRESDPILNNVKRSHFCRRILALENSPKYATNTLYKDTCSASRKEPKSNLDGAPLLDCSGAWSSSSSPIFIWLQNDFGHDVWAPSDEKIGDVINGFRAEGYNTAIHV